MSQKVAIFEIGGSHDECILSQLIALKNAGATTVFCGSRSMFVKNSQFANYTDEFHEVVLPHSMIGDFKAMIRLNKWFVKNNISTVIANTAQGGHVRNLCLTASKKVKFYGLIHTIKMLDGSFTQSLISKKIKDYFVLNDTLKKYIGEKKGITISSFYPLNYPTFDNEVAKPNNQIWISIIGGVESRRKDLEGFIEMAKAVPDHVHFYFLGKSNTVSDEVRQFIEQLEANNLSERVHLFEHFISEQQFDAFLKQTDAIFPLVHPNTPSAEEYFSRQISGAINVAFSYKIPMMIHEQYQDWEDFKSGVVFYNLNNFDTQFGVFMDEIDALKSQLVNNQKFSTSVQNQNFAKIVLNLK